MSAALPSVFLFTLGDRAPKGLGETPCYLYRRAHARRCKHLQAIPEGPCDEATVAAMFAALDVALDEWALTGELYTDEERATREGTDSEPIVFHPGIDLARARAALEKGGFRVVPFRPPRGAPKFESADEALAVLAHHLEHSSLALARKVTAKTFSHHHLERARQVLRGGATAKYAAPILAGVAAREHLSKQAAAVLDLLLAFEREHTEGPRATPRPDQRQAAKAAPKVVVKTVKKLRRP